MVGCLNIYQAKKWSLKFTKKYLSPKTEQRCAPPAPACGLYLKKIIY